MKHLLDLPQEQIQESTLLVDYITQLVKSIVINQEQKNLAQAVLHHLGHEFGFNFQKIVYVVENPDFHQMIGVAGYDKQECNLHSNDIWSNLEDFNNQMQEAAFNTLVTSISHTSEEETDKKLQMITQQLGMSHCECITWNMKHGNHGFFLFEPSENLNPWLKNVLENTVSLLSFCPIHS
jgi:hypothetical protein